MSRLHHLEAIFKNLATVGYVPKSPATTEYNCIAYAAGDVDRPWVGYRCAGYWPEGAREGKDIYALVEAYQRIGFVECFDESVEPGFEKVALYADSRGDWTHAALQWPDGRWTSKIGAYEDIIHNTPYALCGPDRNYGTVFGYMKRPKIA